MIKHHWIEWDDFTDDYIRMYQCAIIIPNSERQVIFSSAGGGVGVHSHHLVEYRSPTSGDTTIGVQPRLGIPPTMAGFVFSHLQYPRWHRPGGRAIMTVELGMVEWLAENLTTPGLGIRTNNLLYWTSDSLDDMTLVRIRYGSNHYMALK